MTERKIVGRKAAELRKKMKQAWHNYLRQVNKVREGKEARVPPSFWYQVYHDYKRELTSMKRGKYIRRV